MLGGWVWVCVGARTVREVVEDARCRRLWVCCLAVVVVCRDVVRSEVVCKEVVVVAPRQLPPPGHQAIISYRPWT